MITGGVLDAKEKGVPGELKMPPEMVKAVCDRAHQLGYKVAAHVESSEGSKSSFKKMVLIRLNMETKLDQRND